MQISYNGINAIKEDEGFRADAYKDTGGVWTIGYGTTRINGKPVSQGMTCTVEQATVWLYADIALAQTAVNQMVRVALQQNQYDALVGFVYNIGVGAFSKSTMLRKLNTQDYIGASQEFAKWNLDNGKVVQGIVNRREREREMFAGPSSNS